MGIYSLSHCLFEQTTVCIIYDGVIPKFGRTLNAIVTPFNSRGGSIFKLS